MANIGPSSTATTPGTTAFSPRIVVADDEAHIRLVVGEKFRSGGCTVVEARDGEEALELVRGHMPHLLITDLQMPYMNGLELCTRLAADQRTAAIPAILLTARGHIITPEQIGTSTIRKVLSKPFSAKGLYEQAMALVGASATGGSTLSAQPTPLEKAA